MTKSIEAPDDGPETTQDATQHPDSEPKTRRRRWWRWVAAATAVVVVFLAVTAVTGLPAPGALHRYPYTELHDLADAIDSRAGPLRTPDDCWREVDHATGPIREIDRVDLLRSRVVVRAYASRSGEIDPLTFNAVADEIDTALATNPSWSWQMVVIEPSPDGWSPLVSCRRVTSGWVTGF